MRGWCFTMLSRKLVVMPPGEREMGGNDSKKNGAGMPCRRNKRTSPLSCSTCRLPARSWNGTSCWNGICSLITTPPLSGAQRFKASTPGT